MLELRKVCADFGLETEVRRCSWPDLRSLAYPVIVHIYDSPSRQALHYMVITRLVNDHKIEVIDGTDAQVHEFFLEKMDNVWQGYVLVPTGRRHRADFAWIVGIVAAWLLLGTHMLRRGSPTKVGGAS
jgi:ABC-type bacteriocin/lantibiotic exporter with double-glycine peptidase domain